MNKPDEYTQYASQTGHDNDCSWVQWVVDGKYYPNPGCTCCRYYHIPDFTRWQRFLNWIKNLSAVIILFLTLTGCQSFPTQKHLDAHAVDSGPVSFPPLREVDWGYTN